jgi:flavin reductase (DIM6/NTAB) family NADH-FMN oxidoreductase RutF
MKIDPADLNPKDSAHLLTDIVIPRPIAWVSTVDPEGRFNLAPFSAYGMVCSKPMVVGFSVSTYRDGKKKDTLLNLTATREFVVNLVTEALVQKMNMTASDYPHEVSEFDKAELIPVKADLVKAPMVGESPMNMECRVLQIMEFGKLPTFTSFIIGEVLRVHIRDEYYNQDQKRISGLRAIGRLGGEQDLYCLGQDTFELKRKPL